MGIGSYAIMRECPRKAALNEGISNLSKYGSISILFEKVMRDMQFDAVKNKANIENAVDTEFSSANLRMLPFEVDAEKARMKRLLQRFEAFESGEGNQILITDQKVPVFFGGQVVNVKVHALLKSGVEYRAVVYKYYSTDLKSTGRTLQTSTRFSPELLLIEKAGKEIAKRMGLNENLVVPYIYTMKSKRDTGKSEIESFNEKQNDNIVTVNFTDKERQDIEDEFRTLHADLKIEACDPKMCISCQNYDLCKMEFVPHEKEQEEELVIAPIDEINLSADQEKVVAFNNGVLRINASAGSGKTTTMSIRLLGLIEEGADPKRIEVVTFTEKAAGEARARTKAYAKGKSFGKAFEELVDDVAFDTFNSFGQRILDEHYALIGFAKAPTVIKDKKKMDILAGLVNKYRDLPLNYTDAFLVGLKADGAVEALKKIVDALKANHAATAEDVRKIVPLYAADLAKAQKILDVYNEYNEEIMNLGYIDFEDQLRLLLNLRDKGIFEQFNFEHIIIDEFQDSNDNQIEIILELASRCNNGKGIKSLVVVGDAMQSIYGFRNATPENFVGFKTYFPQMKDLFLAENFRSENPIVALANTIVENASPIAVEIKCHSKEKGITPAVVDYHDDDEEASLFARQAKKLIEKDGVRPDQIAVLARTKKELLKIQQTFDKIGVPTLLKVPRIIGDEPFVKAIISFASWMENNDNMLDFALYAKSMGMDPFDRAELQKAATAVMEGLKKQDNEEGRIAYFLKMVEHCKKDYVGEAFLTSLEEEGLHTLGDYLDYCVKYRQYGIKETISSRKEASECVNLITIHSAKGLEWDTVLFTAKAFTETNKEDDRLFYVAVTRAKKRLLISLKKKQHRLRSLMQPKELAA